MVVSYERGDPVIRARSVTSSCPWAGGFVWFFFATLVTGPTRSLSLQLSDKRVYVPIEYESASEPLHENLTHFPEMFPLKLNDLYQEVHVYFC